MWDFVNMQHQSKIGEKNQVSPQEDVEMEAQTYMLPSGATVTRG